MAKWLFLLRSFFPSWRFFDDVGLDLTLELRQGTSSNELSDWHTAIPAIQRELNLTFNPKAGLLHASHNLLSHLNYDILVLKENEDIRDKTSFKITHKLARYFLKDSDFVYQFRIRSTSTKFDKSIVLLSETYGEDAESKPQSH